MSLTGGEQIGHYTIQSLIGKGGMGEAYRAVDTKLEREVAIKVLPAALNHPNIAAIYGPEDRAIVMELVESPPRPSSSAPVRHSPVSGTRLTRLTWLIVAWRLRSAINRVYRVNRVT